jgi:signal transduction histidine kinase
MWKFLFSLRYRIILSIVVIEAVMLSIMVWANTTEVRETHSERLAQSADVIMQQFTTTVGRYLIEADYASLEEYANAVMQHDELDYIVVLDTWDAVLLNVGKAPDLNGLQEIPSVSQEGVLDVSGGIVFGGKQRGAVRMGFSLAQVERTVQEALSRGIAIAATEIVLSVIAAFLLGHVLTRNLKTLSLAAERFGRGEAGVVLPLQGRDEIAQVAAAFNGMIGEREQAEQRLRESEKELRRLNTELEDRVAQRTAELEAANREMEAFTYSVSHDLRAPLRTVDGFSRILLEDCSEQVDEKAKHYLARVRAGTKRMGALIDDLLKLSRSTRGDMAKRQVDLSALAEGAAEKLRERDRERTVEFRIQSGVKADGDPQFLGVVLDNLIGNAFKYTGKTDQARIEFGATRRNGEAVYFVSDNGAGFDMAHADKLFVPFQRLHRMVEFEGNGVGLATVNRIVLRHGGRIWAEGEVKKGATFYFTL